MNIRMLCKVEDSNIFTDLGDPLIVKQDFTIGHRKNKYFVQRVDKLSPALGVIDVPISQAINLIDLGYAEEA